MVDIRINITEDFAFCRVFLMNCKVIIFHLITADTAVEHLLYMK